MIPIDCRLGCRSVGETVSWTANWTCSSFCDAIMKLSWDGTKFGCARNLELKILSDPARLRASNTRHPASFLPNSALSRAFQCIDSECSKRCKDHFQQWRNR